MYLLLKVIKMKTNTSAIFLLVAAVLLPSAVSAVTYHTYGETVVNGNTYNLSPGANLTDADLSNANLPVANLSGATLYRANFIGAQLIYANLSGADLRAASLIIADLTGANLSNADMRVQFAMGINLSYANLSGANMAGTYITTRNGGFWNATALSSSNFSYANLSSADLTHTNLRSANLTGANLSGTNLTGIDLWGATVSYSNWTDFYTNSGAVGLDSYAYNTNAINYNGAAAPPSPPTPPSPVPEPSTYGLIGIGALGVAFAARRRKQKTA